MVMAAAFAVLVMLVMVVLMLLMVMMVMLVLFMVMAAAFAVLVMLVMMVLMLVFQLLQHGIPLLHGLQNLHAGELIPGRGNHNGMGILLLEQCHSGLQLLFTDAVRPAQNDGTSRFHLVVIELAEVLHIHFAFVCVRHSDGIAQLNLIRDNLFYRGNHIAELAHTGGLDENPVRRILGNDLLQSLAEIADQTAADTAGVHLRDFNPGLLQKAAVNADLAKLIFNQDQFLTGIGLPDHFFDQRRLASAQKTRIHINFCHTKHLRLSKFYRILYHLFPELQVHSHG